MDTLEYRLFHQRHPPHYQPPGSTLFVTFRLAGSIPTQLLNDLLDKKEKLSITMVGLTETDRTIHAEKIDRQIFGYWDQALERWKEGPVWLQDQRIALLVSDALYYGDGKYYDLEAFCLMPNHVHILFTPKQKSELD